MANEPDRDAWKRAVAAVMRRVGVFGGTFDPPHLGHLVIAEWARARLGLERVLFVPSGVPWYQSPVFLIVGAVVVIVGFIMILLLLGFIRLWVQSLLTGRGSASSTWSG